MISTNTVTGRRTTIFYKNSASRENWSIVNYIGYIKLIQKQKLVNETKILKKKWPRSQLQVLTQINHIRGVMVSVLATSAVDRGFKSW